ncbi:hypothetical protein [Rhodobacter capsulatus]|jgi:hypothetical protein|uniref:Uncharacterized protein n=1 Tax=Rhodobacter capsulatus (strain ATCC BAA-309 / NBRC 16581 / SB1003) TaxID=272942 RepID=D5ASC3_RHOCB|nr:hypothetical protein [Rhodobacter capsulatus]ADE85014.1 conserved hypothetical protein [Rhodobacter capsulatus SB 1003]ETD02158.1 hypothetical protein U714_07530 [Rhodobacter capsulatus DE442]ETD77848.1 hypothetical protein U717_07705 [Rhodobacter capsulatus R121]ETE54190.1 hypothetical protein U715_07700 [Rhodobacter capsulatus Y262]MDS0926669.1 hypothetical protein [Rhodobacter capsulatus]
MTTDEKFDHIRHALAGIGVEFIELDDDTTKICDAAIAEDFAKWAAVISVWADLIEEAR